jgi:hypothetical protein
MQMVQMKCMKIMINDFKKLFKTIIKKNYLKKL